MTTAVTKEKCCSEVPKLNPLELPELLPTIFSNISKIEDLKALRLVNRLWRDESLYHWRSTAVFVVNQEFQPILLNAFPTCDKPELAETSKESLFCPLIPFQMYRIRLPFGSFHSYPVDKFCISSLNKEILSLWDNYFRYAKYLDLGECLIRENDDEDYNLGLNWILMNSPGLQELDIVPYRDPEPSSGSQSEARDNEGTGDQLEEIEKAVAVLNQYISVNLRSLSISTSNENKTRRTYIPLFQYEDHFLSSLLGYRVLQAVPNLKTLNLQFEDGTDPVLQALSYHTTVKLESLHISASPTETDWLALLQDYLEGAGPPLKTLEISIHWQDFTWPAGQLHRILRLCQSTLTKLELNVDCDGGGRIPFDTNVDMRGCVFPELKELKVNLDYFNSRAEYVGFDFSVLRRAPKIQKFHFGQSRKVERVCVTRKVRFLTQYEGESLQSLREFHFHGNFFAETLTSLGRTMGNLEKLEVVLDKENFVCVNIWPQLKQLTLLPCSTADEEMISKLKISNPTLEIINQGEYYDPAVRSDIED